MAAIPISLEDFLTGSGLSQIKTTLDQVINNPQDTAKIVLTHLLDQADLPIEVPVDVVIDGATYVIEASEDLNINSQAFFLHGLASALNRFRLVINQAGDAVEEVLIEAESEIESLRDRVSNELSKIPYRIQIRDNNGTNEFFIIQTDEIESKIQGVDVLLKTSSLTFTSSELSQLALQADVFFPGMTNEAGTEPLATEIELAYGNGQFTGTAQNVPLARLQGIQAQINQCTVIFQNDEFQPGTSVSGELIFNFLDDGQNGPGKIDFSIALQNNGDVQYQAQNPEGQELKKGSISVFFQEIRVTTHTAAPVDVIINGWAELPGVVDQNTQQQAKTNFSFAYADPHFSFTGSNFVPIPMGFGTATFDSVFLQIHKNGTLVESTWEGDLQFPFFNNGQLDFAVNFVNANTDRLTIDVSNPSDLPISHGDFQLLISQYQMVLESGETQNITGNGQLNIPVVTNGQTIDVQFGYQKNGQDETVEITANNFGTPNLGGCELSFSTIQFSFLNGTLQSSDIEGRIQLPDTTDGAGLAFDLEIQNQGNDYTIALDGSAQDNELIFGPVHLAVDAFELLVQNEQLQSVSGNGTMQLPGLNHSFAFQFDVNTAGPDPIYTITVQNVSAELDGFALTFTQVQVSSQASQQFSANASGTLVLPVFSNGTGLDFTVAFAHDNSYQITVNAGPELVSFGDFSLSQVALSLNVQEGTLQDFSGSAQLQIPGFNSTTGVSVNYTEADSRYLIDLDNAIDVDLFGGALHLDDFALEILNEDFESCNASGNFKLPDSTGGAGIQFTIDVDESGESYTINLTGTPNENTLEFGPVQLAFAEFELVVQNGDVQSVSGSGSLTIPGLQDAFDFSISVDTSGQIPIYIIEVLGVGTQLESFQLFFDQIRIESQQPNFDLDINGNVTLPVFSGNPIDFELTVDENQNSIYTIAINGTGSTATFGAVELRDVVFDIEVINGNVQNASGSAALHIPEITQSNAPLSVEVAYQTQPNEDFSFTTNNLPTVDFSVFSLTLSHLSFLIRNGNLHTAEITGSATMPFFTNGGGLNFSFSFENDGSVYSAQILSTGTLVGSGLELKNVDISVAVANGTLDEISGSAEFKIPGANSFTGVTISYENANDKLLVNATSLPQFDLAGLHFNFANFGFGLENGNLVDTNFTGEVTIGAFESPNNVLGFEFDLLDGNNYSIEINPGGNETELKLGDLSLFIGTFEMNVVNGDVDSINATAGLEFEGLQDENNDSQPARIDIDFSYDNPSETYSIALDQNQAVDIGGFALTLTSLQISFTPDQLTYPFSFIGEMEIPGLEDGQGGQASVGVNIQVTDADNFSGSLTSDAEFEIGGIKVSVTELSLTKNGNVFEVGLRGLVTFEMLSGDGPATMEVEIEIASDGTFKVLGEIEAPNAIKVVDIPSVVKIYLNKLGLERDSGNNWDFTLGGLIENKIVIPGMEDLLPSQLNLKELVFGNDFNIDMDIRWPSGLSISFGGEQAEAIIPVNGKFGTAVSLDALKITYVNNGNNGADVSVSFQGASVALGPVAAVVDGLGVVATLTKPQMDGNGKPIEDVNFGIVNLDVAFLPPNGLGVSLDTPVFTGGGYLYFDNEKEEYAGALELSFMNMFAVAAIGIINNKMPDGKPGTSVLFIVSVEFSPGIALGFGFFLSGLGGMLGVHRTINVEKLRDGVRQGTIQNILFPKNIIQNISKIISDIKEIFPIKRDQFIIGPMAAITWGVPTIVRVDLGLAIEFDNPVRFGILGVLRVILPDEQAALVKIQVAFLGMIDFQKGMLSFDASLFDSKVLTFGLEGDMALRICWGEKADFALSVGGFHPRYKVPTHLQIPPMKRLTLKILSGNPRLTLTTYFAVTSNTVQFGAGIDFYFGVAGFSIVGEFGFDVLFQFSPFRFIADARARLAVKAGGATILSLSLEFSLEGPTPWRAHGTAKFKILFFTIKAKFDVTWGDKKDTTLPAIDVLPLLLEAVEDRQNWRSITQSSHIDGMRMRSIVTEDELILTPNGTIEITQKIVPLRTEINKFGQYQPGDFTKFDIIDAEVGDEDADETYIQDEFSPANFLDVNDNDKLALPSFEKQDCGIVLKANSSLKTGSVLDREVLYEQNVMDEEPNAFGFIVQQLGGYQFSANESNWFAQNGAVAKAKVSAAKKSIFNPNKVVVREPKYAVVNTDNLAVVNGLEQVGFMQAQAEFSTLNQSNYQVVSNDVLNQ